MISHSEARMIAADWHGGQWSALYALSSSGAISSAASIEACKTLRMVCLSIHYSYTDELQLSDLCEFLDHAEETWCAENPDAEDFPEYLYGPGEWED